MRTISQIQPVFIDILLPRAETKMQAMAKDIVLVLSFSLLTALSAQVSFWMGPVPITGQTFAVLISGILLGSIRGAFSQVIYLLIGISGVPFWFAAGGVPGIARLMGPTGGYLIGFIFTAFIVGRLAEAGWSRTVKKAIIAMLVGNIVIYIFGLSWLVKFIPPERLLIVGIYPFIIGDLFKILLAGSILPFGWRLIQKVRVDELHSSSRFLRSVNE